MKELRGLRSRLFALLARSIAQRFLAWLSCALIFLSLGTSAAAILGLDAVVQLGLALAAFSALPVFLLWPPREGLLERGLRRLDEGSVFESLLEAPNGPARSLLRAMAAERSSALADIPPKKERMPRRTFLLLASAMLCLAAVETVSLIVAKRPLFVYAGPEGPIAGGRAEEGSFAGPDERRPDEVQPDEEGQEGIAGKNRPEAWDERSESGQAAAEGIAQSRRRQAEAEMETLPDTGSDGAARNGGSGALERNDKEAAIGESGGSGEISPSMEGGGKETSPRVADKRGRGFESSADTKIPSPIGDYRARFSRVYAGRTGKRFAASGRLELKELAEFERRFFASFALSADIAPPEDPYDALLKRRWRELRGQLE